MEYHRPRQARKQWEDILNSWLRCDRKTKDILLEQYPEIFSRIVYNLRSGVTVLNDIIFIRDAWKEQKQGIETLDVGLNTLLQEFSNNSFHTDEITELFS